MSLYTFIFEFAGGTYVSQVKAASPKSACVKAAQNLNPAEIAGLGTKTKELLIEQMKGETPVPLNDISNVWCNSAVIRGELAVINVVQTEE